MTLSVKVLGELVGTIERETSARGEVQAPPPALEGARLEETAREDLEGAAAARAAIEADRPIEGWLCLTDRVIELPAELPAGGVPLEGEWTLADGASARLRHLGRGKWRLVRLRRAEDPAGCLVERRFHRFGAGEPTTGEELLGRGLRYEVEWALRGDAHGLETMQPVRARFAGFCVMSADDEGNR